MDEQLILSSPWTVSHDAYIPPFERVARSLEPYKQCEYASDGRSSPTTLYRVQSIAAKFNALIVPQIRALFPQSTSQRMLSRSSGAETQNRLFTEAQLRLIVYAAMNSLDRIDGQMISSLVANYLDDPVKAIIRDLSLVRSPSALLGVVSTLKPMAGTLFLCAIESVDIYTIETITNTPGLKVDINRLACKTPEGPVTPVQRSSALQHRRLTQLLLHLGADVNRTYETTAQLRQLSSFVRRTPASNALDHVFYEFDAVSGYDTSSGLAIIRPVKKGTAKPDFELVNMLAKAGAVPGIQTLNHLISMGHLDSLETILTTSTEVKCKYWLENGVLHRVVSNMNELSTCHLLEIFGSKVAAIHATEQNRWHHWPSLIDMAVIRGFKSVVQRLRALGLQYTTHTAVAALRGGNLHLCQMLLCDGADFQCYSSYFNTSPYAEALKCKDKSLTGLLQLPTFAKSKPNPEHTCAVLRALVETGEAEEIKVLLKSEARRVLSQGCLQFAINRALEHDHSSIAITLMGVDLCEKSFEDGDHSEWCQRTRRETTMTIALKNRDASMVSALVEHEIPLHISSESADAAIEWGDLSILHVLFRHRDGLFEALLSAINKESLVCVQFLLQLIQIQTEEGRLGSGEISNHLLSAAVRTGNESILTQLIDHGIKLDNAAALNLAVTERSPLLYTLIEAIRKDQSCSARRHHSFNFALCAFTSAILLDLTDEVRQFLDLGIDPAACAVEAASGRLDSNSLLSDRFGNNVDSPLSLDGASWLYAAVDRRSVYRSAETLWGLQLSPLGAAILKESGKDLILVRALLNNCRDLEGALAGPAIMTQHEAYSPLNLAAATKCTDMVQLLIDLGADANEAAKLYTKRTPLQRATEVGAGGVVQLLISEGAEVNGPAAVSGGATAIQLAAREGYIGIAELLLDHGADIYAPAATLRGNTALDGAAERGRYDMIHFLSCRFRFSKPELDSAIRHATDSGYCAVVELLQSIEPNDRTPNLATTPIIANYPDPSPPTQVAQGLPPACSFCGEIFSRKFTLKRHLLTAHHINGNNDSQNPNLFRYECPICHRKFTRKDTMERHRATHSGGGNVQCSQCGEDFSRGDYLAAHQKGRCKGSSVARQVAQRGNEESGY